jgi:formamidopyrimidine-DNA glycosylase
MPEIPEVETTRRGIAAHALGRRVLGTQVREHRLRWPIPDRLDTMLAGGTIQAVERRAKYLLLRTDRGTLIIHLGMSGSLRIVPADHLPERHDHLDVCLAGGLCLRLRDPRRFGTVLWTERDPLTHPLLAAAGLEPLDPELTGDYLYRQASGRKLAVKSLLMDARVVAGVGNIYANEALFLSGIHPHRPAHRISLLRYRRLAERLRAVLLASIECGGTTLRDFTDGNGDPGYFQLELHVYGKSQSPCPACGRPIRRMRIGQRSSFYCPHCQR